MREDEAAGGPGTAEVELVDFGLQPVSNRFLLAGETGEAPRYPLSLRLNLDSGLIGLAEPFPVEEVRPRFDWMTYSEPEDHLDEVADRARDLPGIDGSAVVAGVSYKDDTTIDRLRRRGLPNSWRLDPRLDLGVDDASANIETLQSALTPEAAEKVARRNQPADIMIVRHVLEHAYNLPEFIDAVRRLTRPDGYIVWEVPDCRRSLELGDCTVVWEEHVHYFTAFTFRQVLMSAGLTIVHEEIVPYALENSLVCIVQNASSATGPATPADEAAVQRETERAQGFSRLVLDRTAAVRRRLEQLRTERGPVVLFGAGHFAVAFLALTGTERQVRYVIDDNPRKKGMKMPVGGIEIVGAEVLEPDHVGACLLAINPQSHGAVMARHRAFIEGGGIMASIFPGSENEL